MELKDKIIKTLKLKSSKNNISLTTNFKDMGIDSLSLMDMIVNLEDEMNITLPDDEILELKNIQDLINLVSKIKK